MIGFHTSLACHKLVEEVVGTFLHACVTSNVVVVSDLGDLSLQKMAADYEFFQGRCPIFTNQKCQCLTYWHQPRLLAGSFGLKLNVQIIESVLTSMFPIQKTLEIIQIPIHFVNTAVEIAID